MTDADTYVLTFYYTMTDVTVICYGYAPKAP
jgi:hypothetical protein